MREQRQLLHDLGLQAVMMMSKRYPVLGVLGVVVATAAISARVARAQQAPPASSAQAFPPSDQPPDQGASAQPQEQPAASAQPTEQPPAQPSPEPPVAPAPAQAPGLAPAPEPAPVAPAAPLVVSGLEAGFRTGYGFPLGKAADDASRPMHDAIAGQIPIWLEAGPRIHNNFTFQLAFQYGIGLIGSPASAICDADPGSCSTHVIRLGPQAIYHLAPFQPRDPWFGLGVGLEWWSFSETRDGAELSSSFRGYEFLGLQGGYDFALGKQAAIGPFMSISFDEYTKSDISMLACNGPDCFYGTSGSSAINHTSLHEWIVIGVRITGVAVSRRSLRRR